MEAVRELLFGQRVTELHQRIQTNEERFSATLQNADGVYGQRFQNIEISLSAAEGRLSQRLASEQNERLAQAEQAKKNMEERFAALEHKLGMFMADCQKQFQSIASDITALRKDLQAEATYLKQSMPTVNGLADLFRSTADRMRSSLAVESGPGSNPPPQSSTVSALDGLSA